MDFSEALISLVLSYAMKSLENRGSASHVLLHLPNKSLEMLSGPAPLRGWVRNIGRRIFGTAHAYWPTSLALMDAMLVHCTEVPGGTAI
jgi:hypothetical protein